MIVKKKYEIHINKCFKIVQYFLLKFVVLAKFWCKFGIFSASSVFWRKIGFFIGYFFGQFVTTQDLVRLALTANLTLSTCCIF